MTEVNAANLISVANMYSLHKPFESTVDLVFPRQAGHKHILRALSV